MIRRNSDGVVRVTRKTYDPFLDSDYIWTEGNYACDCNRSVFFNLAAPGPLEERAPCGNTAYTIMSPEEIAG